MIKARVSTTSSDNIVCLWSINYGVIFRDIRESFIKVVKILMNAKTLNGMFWHVMAIRMGLMDV